MEASGWILDAYAQNSQIVLWIKKQDGGTLCLTDQSSLDFYLEPKEDLAAEELCSIVQEHPQVETAKIERKYTSVNAEEKTNVIHVYVSTAERLRNVIHDLKEFDLSRAFYNTDLLHVQRYLFHKKLEALEKVEVEFDDDFKVRGVRSTDDEAIAPPPFSTLIFRIKIQSSSLLPSSERDPISQIMILDENLHVEKCLDGPEQDILQFFSELIRQTEPDIIVTPREERYAFRYLVDRARNIGLEIRLGRFDVGDDLQRPYYGRVHLDLETFHQIGLAGLAEKSRFALLPIGVVSGWGPARIIDSRQCYEAMKRDMLLPSSRRGVASNVLTAKEVAFKDRGALIQSPKIGIHENVAELDFESLFPLIIVKRNISYETVSALGIDSHKRGFLPELVEGFINRRICFKHQRSKYPEGSAEWEWCEQRQLLLKKLLVCLYGYSGSDLNRFSNPFAYREINRIGRETVLAAMNIAMREGYEVIYLDTDSIFVKRPSAAEQDYLELADVIRREVGFPISLKHHYKFLVLLPQEADPEIEAARRFYGRLIDGKIYYRGIELRRHDYPIFLKDFQKQLLTIILDADTADEIRGRQFRKALDYTISTYEEMLDGKINPEKLVISKILRMPIRNYRSLFPHVIAAIQLEGLSKPIKPGETVEYVYVDAAQMNPMKRVLPASIAHSYDCQKYAEMLLDTAETLLGVFGFSRTLFSLQPKPRGFLEELRRERDQEIILELENLED